MTHDDIVNALTVLMDKLLFSEPVDALTLANALKAVRLLNEVGFQ